MYLTQEQRALGTAGLGRIGGRQGCSRWGADSLASWRPNEPLPLPLLLLGRGKAPSSAESPFSNSFLRGVLFFNN